MHRIQQFPPAGQQEFLDEMCAAMLAGCALRAEYATQYREAAARARGLIDSSRRLLDQVNRTLGEEELRATRGL